VPETFADRFVRLVGERSDTDVGAIMGVTADAVRKLRTGDVKSLKLVPALRLCREFRISPWDLAGERAPAEQPTLPGNADAAGSPLEPEFARHLAQLSRDVSTLALEVKRLRGIVEPASRQRRRNAG
jgi:DNA-binding Xre family transcriptional regulator